MSGKEYAGAARNFCTVHQLGVLSTISVEMKGHPFGSIVPYDIDGRGRPIIYISQIAQHFKNLRADPRGAITVVDAFGADDSQASGRATMMCVFSAVETAEQKELLASYQSRFSHSLNYSEMHDFVLMRAEVLRVRWSGGFGAIGWVSGGDYSAAEPDPLAYSALDAIRHMNDDHRDALVLMLRAHQKIDALPIEVQMIGLDRDGFTVRHQKHGAMTEYRVSFPQPVTRTDDLRRMMMQLTAAARVH